jgi:hypothetical protein
LKNLLISIYRLSNPGLDRCFGVAIKSTYSCHVFRIHFAKVTPLPGPIIVGKKEKEGPVDFSDKASVHTFLFIKLL